MSYEKDVLELFAAANPARDDEEVDVVELEPAAYLATLQTRSSEVTQLDERTSQQTHKSSWFMAAAAVAVVLIGAVVFMLTQGDGEQPVATQPPVDTTVTSQPASPTGAGLEGSWALGNIGATFEGETYQFTLDGILVDSGTFETTDPTTLALRSDQNSPGCSINDAGRWSFEAGDELSLIGLDEPCLFRTSLTPQFEPGVFTRSDDLVVTEGALDLSGSWGDESDVVTFEGGSYTFVVDGETVDSGTYQIIESPYRIALTPRSGDGETCGPTDYEFAFQQENGALFLEGSGDLGCEPRQALAFRGLLPIDGS